MTKNVQKAINVIEGELKKMLELRHHWEQEEFDSKDEVIGNLNEDIKAMERVKFILTSL